jgi:anaerobic ribonucleoside-triphosphate reductase activating protein
MTPELWQQPPQDIDLVALLEAENFPTSGTTGVTISGGEPFYQPQALLELTTYIRSKGIDDILVYTGYALEELLQSPDPAIAKILGNISVLIDGEYVEAQDIGQRMQGSTNQRMHFLKKQFEEEYLSYAAQPRQVQSFIAEGNYYIAGLLPKGVAADIRQKILEKGI